MKKVLLLLIVLHALIADAQYSWIEKMHYGGVPVYDAFSFVVGSKGYVGTGRDITMNYYNDLWEYNPSADSWTQLANLPATTRFSCRAFSIGNNGYIVSGYSPSSGFLNELWEYNTITNTWTQKAPHPGVARYTGIALALNSKGYFGLGSVGSGNYQNDFYEYDPALNSWTAKPNFPGVARQGSSWFVINNEAYVGLGSNVQLNSNYNDFFKYNPVSNSWTSIASFPGTPRNGAFSFSISGEGYILMGFDHLQTWPSPPFHDFWKYNPTTNLWTQLPDFPDTARYEGIHFEIGGNGYIGLGSDTTQSFHYMGDFWEYTQEKGTPVIEYDGINAGINIYPNLSEGMFHCIFNNEMDVNLFLFIYDKAGRQIKSFSYNELLSASSIDLREFSSGIYLYQVVSRNNLLKSGKLFIQK